MVRTVHDGRLLSVSLHSSKIPSDLRDILIGSILRSPQFLAVRIIWEYMIDKHLWDGVLACRTEYRLPDSGVSQVKAN